MSVKLNNKARYRREASFIYLCDLRTLRDFEIPLEHWQNLELIRQGAEPEHLSDEAQTLIRDLDKLGLMSDEDVSPSIWEKMEFE